MQARVKSWLRAVTRRRELEAEMAEELLFHMEARAADLETQGLEPVAARRQARVEFGAVAAHQDGMRRALGLRWWDELWADLRYAVRLLARSPGFTAIAVASLALAIGANTTIFSLANEVLFARLGVPHPQQLRMLSERGDEHVAVHSTWGNWDRQPGGGSSFTVFTYPVYKQLQHQNQRTHQLQDIFAFKDSIAANATVDKEAQAVQVEMVSGNLYQQMGVQPQLGRGILPADDGAPGTGAVAVISDGFWSRTFGRSPTAVGQTVVVNMTPVTIVGVNPRGFTGAASVQSSPDLFLPMSMITQLRTNYGDEGNFLDSKQLAWVKLMARAQPGVPTQQAQASLDVALSAATRATMPVGKDDTMPRMVLSDGSRGTNEAAMTYARPIYVLLTMVGLVLLLACANIANLMLARATARQREMAVRLALGAGRVRLLRQMLTESLLLSTMGGALGLLMGYLGRTALPNLLLQPWEHNEMQVPFDWRVFGFTAVVTLGTGLLFGLAPAWRATRVETSTMLKEGGKGATRRRKAWSGRAIVSFQVGLSTLLVVAAILFLRTIVNLYSIDPGFRADHLLLFEINPPSKQYPDEKDVALLRRLEEALRAVPGVQGVTLSDTPLLSNYTSNSNFFVEHARSRGARGKNTGAYLADVGPDFTQVMGIPMVAGRPFTAQDAASGRAVSIVNASLARKFFGNANPVGQRFRMTDRPPSEDQYFEIVGVCADTLYAQLRDGVRPVHFDLYTHQKEFGGATFIVRTDKNIGVQPEALVPSLRAAINRIDRNLPMLHVRTQKQQMDETMQTERIFASLSAGFGVLALALACVGIYGIMAYTVSQRTNEIGIRLALGARREQVRAMVLREAGWLTVLGVVGGLVAALALGRLVGSMLFGLKAADPVSLVGAAAILVLVALLAGWIPASRASNVDPMVALRHE